MQRRYANGAGQQEKRTGREKLGLEEELGAGGMGLGGWTTLWCSSRGRGPVDSPLGKVSGAKVGFWEERQAKRLSACPMPFEGKLPVQPSRRSAAAETRVWAHPIPIPIPFHPPPHRHSPFHPPPIAIPPSTPPPSPFPLPLTQAPLGLPSLHPRLQSNIPPYVDGWPCPSDSGWTTTYMQTRQPLT